MKKLYYLLIVFSFALLTACAQTPEEEISKVYQGGPPETVSNNQTTMAEFDQTAMPEAGDQIAVIKTSMGTIKIRLFPTKTPKTVENFIGLIENGYYDGIIFHRVITGFMIQGGDPAGTGAGGESLWGGKFEDEPNKKLSNMPGSIAMANAGPNTNGSQFFINQGNNDFLDCHNPASPSCHTVFGQVFEGMDTVDAIISVERDGRDKPLKDVKMEKVTVETYE